MTEDRAETSPGPNPFGPSAVAGVSESPDMVSVPTTATRKAIQHLNQYLEDTAVPADGAGSVLALVGDYGAGKTHLAALLRNQVALEHEDRTGTQAVTCVYLDATASFQDLYYRFVEALTEAQVHDRVRGLYTRIVAQRLGGSDRAGPARDLLDDPDLDPLQVTSGLGLAEPDLLEDLQRQLSDITDNRRVAVVLSLLLRPGFRDRAWNWLRGGKPALALRERDITEPLQTEELAVDAFIALARLHGAQEYPLVVIVDELDRLFAESAAPQSEQRRLLPRFLQSFVKARALLVLAAVDESISTLDSAARARIGTTIQLRPFDLTQTRQFITKCLERVRLTGLGPFTESAVTEIVALTEGNPRRIRLYCKHLFAETTGRITPVQVREAARALFGVDKRAEVMAAIPRALSGADWAHISDYFVSPSPTARVDFWLPVGVDSGCALLVSKAIVDGDDTARMIERLAAVRGRERGTIEPFLIVAEALAEAQRPALVEAFGREPVVYHPHSFADDLVAMIKPARQRLEQADGGDTNAVLRHRVETLGQQQDRLQGTLDQVLMSIRAHRTAADSVARELRDELADLRDAATRPARQPGATALPDRVRQLFDDRLAALAELGDAADVVEDVFRTGESRQAGQDGLGTVRTVMQQPHDVTTALGVSAVLGQLIEQFLRAVDEWCRVYVPKPGRRIPARGREELEELCRTYDAAFDEMPMSVLNRLVDLAEAVPQGSPRRENLVLWPDRLFGARQKLESLAAQVRHVLLTSY